MPPGLGGLLISGHHRDRARGRGTWRSDLWSLHRRHGRRRGLRKSGLRRNTTLRHRKRAPLAAFGVCLKAGKWSRLCHTRCDGYHQERCECYGGRRRNAECFHLVTLFTRRFSMPCTQRSLPTTDHRSLPNLAQYRTASIPLECLSPERRDSTFSVPSCRRRLTLGICGFESRVDSRGRDVQDLNTEVVIGSCKLLAPCVRAASRRFEQWGHG